jgi:hypothetical protein
MHHSRNNDDQSLQTLGPESRAGVFGLAKVPRGSEPKLQTKTAKIHFGPESPALEKGRNI